MLSALFPPYVSALFLIFFFLFCVGHLTHNFPIFISILKSIASGPMCEEVRTIRKKFFGFFFPWSMENGDVTDGIVPESVFLESSTDVYVHPDYYKRRHQSQRKRRNQRRAAKMSYAIAQEAVALAALVSAQNGSDLTEELEPQPGCSKQWTEPPVCDHNGKSNEEKAESGSEELSDSVFEAQVSVKG